MQKGLKAFFAVLCLGTASVCFADVSIPIYQTTEQGTGQSVGNIKITETKYGLLFTPDLHDLKPGVHGFHIHQNASCEKNGMSAGGHFDPNQTNKHLGPYYEGHLGDLPAIIVLTDGTATLPVLAPRIHRISEIENRSLMIHDGGDNYSDVPQKLGGGGSRMGCGVIQKQ